MGERRPAQELVGEPGDVAFFDELLAAHSTRFFGRVMRRLPSDPRCRICHAPYSGAGGRVMKRFGFAPSRKNPSLCDSCFEKAPLGGVEMEIGVLFADVRGFTALAERMAPEDVAQLLNRFYAAATKVLTRSAIVDKLVGDEVMALYLPQMIGDGWEDELLRDARELLGTVGYRAGAQPWLALGVGIDAGRAYVGNVGAGSVKDFTALGDVVNTAARLQSAARAGQIVLSERLCGRLAERPAGARAVALELKGKAEPQAAHVLDLGAVGAAAR